MVLKQQSNSLQEGPPRCNPFRRERRRLEQGRLHPGHGGKPPGAAARPCLSPGWLTAPCGELLHAPRQVKGKGSCLRDGSAPARTAGLALRRVLAPGLGQARVARSTLENRPFRSRWWLVLSLGCFAFLKLSRQEGQ